MSEAGKSVTPVGMADSLLIGFDSTNGKDISVLIVGRKTPGEVVEIINAFQGEEANELYRRLITKKSK